MALFIILASRWQPPAVFICTTGIPCACTFSASTLDATSPSITAILASFRMPFIVFRIRLVLPAPGDDITFTARMLCLSNSFWFFFAFSSLAPKMSSLMVITFISI